MLDAREAGSLVCQILGLLIWLGLSIAMITMGALYLHNCSGEPNIPIYLIVAGVFILVLIITYPLKTVSLKFATLDGIIGLFLFAWLIAGSVWVFRNYQDYLAGRDIGCDHRLYLFAFWILIVQYIFMGLTIISSVLYCVFCGISSLKECATQCPPVRRQEC
uniref:Transmembrane protein 272-like n=1 Tax=Geotrypetes seraphini TaxID=260995 RepID=A0A6P8RZP9_GEOSA|nr:transmembrane protein 272-like [Geotrypetes seraphini]